MIKARSQKREARSEKRKAKSEKRKARSHKREVRSEKKRIKNILIMENKFVDIEFLEDPLVNYGQVRNFEELIVWQKSMELVKKIYLVTREIPESEKFGLTNQIRRAVVSIPSNIAEGWGRNSKGVYLNHLKISHGSLCEVRTQLLICESLEFLNTENTKEIKGLLEECSKMLNSMIIKLEYKN